MPTLLHPREVVPILSQARIRMGAKGKLPKTLRSMHCTVSRTCLDIKETENFQDAGRRVGCPGTFWATTKKFKLFPGGASPPQTPPSSRLLSQPPQARFERLSQVGRCRGLQGWEVLGQWFGM